MFVFPETVPFLNSEMHEKSYSYQKRTEKNKINHQGTKTLRKIKVTKQKRQEE